jgi:hypothetical protein
MEIYNDLARTIKEDAKKTAQITMASSMIEIGKITSSGLQLNNFKHPIKNYKMLDYLKLDIDVFTTTESASLSEGHTHDHRVKTPSRLKPLAIGDTVLVASFENDFVVIGRIV